MLEGLRGESSIAELCRKEGINQNLYYSWSKEFLEAGKKRLAGDTAREANSDEVKEHVSNLDLFRPDRQMPFLTQGPIMHIPCQVETLDTDCVLMTFSRGYGQTFVDALLHSASGCKLRPGGEAVFTRWLSHN